MSGLLSQALANAESAEQQIKSLSGLPPAAQQVQSNSAALIATTVPEIKQLQSTVSVFAQKATPQLTEAETLARGTAPLSTVKATMVAVQNEAINLTSTVDGVTSNINAAASQVAAFSNQLAAIESQLTSQKATLQGELNNARRQEASAKKKYDWLILLGLLGLPGLVAAHVLYNKWTSDVNNLASKASALSAQISRHTMMVSATQQLGTDFLDLLTKISGVKNSVDFLTGDIGTIITDVEKTNASRIIIEMYITTAMHEVTTLAIDAS